MALLSPPSYADTGTTTTKMSGGVDFAMPYVLSADGNKVNERGNFNIGVDGRYWITENINAGMRVNFDVEERTPGSRQFAMAPGAQYHWMTTERFSPFARFDLPILLLNKPEQDIGVSLGGGVAWNLGDAIGVQNLLVRYDFAFNWFFGLGNATNNVIALDLFKIGFDYRF